MQFNQLNQNDGDVNNHVTEYRTTTSTTHNGDMNTATSQSGNVAQGVGGGSRAQVVPPKDGFWGELWGKVKKAVGLGA